MAMRRNTFTVLLSAIVLSMMIYTPALLADDVVVDGSAQYQTIEGFGTSIIGWEPKFARLVGKPGFVKTFADDVGCSILRVQLVPQVSPDPVSNPQDIHYQD